eukprot:COSAG01_NODE_2415_length_7736_cov_42.301034_8_plen_71_part_00
MRDPCMDQSLGRFLSAILSDPKSAPRVPTLRMAGLPIAAFAPTIVVVQLYLTVRGGARAGAAALVVETYT